MTENSPKINTQVSLLPGERLDDVIDVQDTQPSRLPSSLFEMTRLTGVSSPSDIGENGPSLASLGLEDANDEPSKHLYETVFGRDSLRVAEDLLEVYPKLTRATLLRMAELQGVGFNVFREEERGRIVHEYRDPDIDAVARDLTLSRGWGWPYYGSVDSTPQFVSLLWQYCEQSDEGYDFLETEFEGRDSRTHKISEALDLAVSWIEGRVEQNREGLLEFRPAFIGSIENQVWKDSWDAYFHDNGDIADHRYGIASIEVQGMTHEALIAAAEIYQSVLGDQDRANRLRQHALHLKRSVMDHFWVEERGGFFALGTSRDASGMLRPMRIKTSNMGHLLKGFLDDDDNPEIVRRRKAVVNQLFGPDMMGLNGIRTLSSEEFRYRPGAYHNGSVWIWDNYLIAQGLAGVGETEKAGVIYAKLLDVIRSTKRFPEYVRGDDDPERRLNTQIVKVFDSEHNRQNQIEQPPQDVMAWSVAAILAIKIYKGTIRR